MTDPAAALAAMRNLGPKSAALLVAAGVDSPATLRRMGAAAAFVAIEPPTSRTILWALEGAISETDWRRLSEQVKADLLADVRSLRGGAADE